MQIRHIEQNNRVPLESTSLAHDRIGADPYVAQWHLLSATCPSAVHREAVSDRGRGDGPHWGTKDDPSHSDFGRSLEPNGTSAGHWSRGDDLSGSPQSHTDPESGMLVALCLWYRVIITFVFVQPHRRTKRVSLHLWPCYHRSLTSNCHCGCIR